jgi:hypothetical protein
MDRYMSVYTLYVIRNLCINSEKRRKKTRKQQ